ncbi:ABC transporter substrate-binding protein/permease [Sandarakinorhabdus sp. DWP1-3-1]|uniref:ABC transporter substrate-binding protein/permease n=1 Tax=Sandarakinorhabdus sp. DWP1-3-1 TaxID=2804627 RepID=UPI003CF145E6
MSGWRCLVLLWLALIAGPLHARSLETIRATGVLRVGVNPNFPPMSSFAADGTLKGFDVDVARRLADRLGVRLQLVPTEAASRVPFLVSGRIDLALGALTITPEREALIDFTVPLHSEAMGVITTAKLPVTRWQDLDRADITLVNMRGNQSVSVLREKLPKPQRLLVDGNADTIRAIAQGRADALVENVDFFVGFTKNHPEIQWRVLPDPIFVAWCGIGVAKGNDGLRAAVDMALRQLHGDGSIAALWRKHYGAAMTVPVAPAQLASVARVSRPTGYRFDWSGVWPELPYLAAGALISLQIAVIAFVAGAAIGLGCALARLRGGTLLRRLCGGYVSFFTNTPALVQIFVLYYALPDVGVKLPAFAAVVLGLTFNAGAYLAEILRGGIVAVRTVELEAAEVLGLGRRDKLVHVMLPSIIRTVYRPLSSFFIVLVLGSSMGALFGVEELTGRAINISTANLRTIETFAVTGLIYIVLTLIASALLAAAGRWLFRVRAP